AELRRPQLRALGKRAAGVEDEPHAMHRRGAGGNVDVQLPFNAAEAREHQPAHLLVDRGVLRRVLEGDLDDLDRRPLDLRWHCPLATRLDEVEHALDADAPVAERPDRVLEDLEPGALRVPAEQCSGAAHRFAPSATTMVAASTS